MSEKKEVMKVEETTVDVEVDFDEEETKQQIRQHEGSLLDCLLAAAEYADGETDTIEIIRRGVKYFEIDIRPLTEDEFMEIRKKYTIYKKNRKNGMRVASEVDAAKYRCSIIYNASTDDCKAKIWDNKTLHEALRKKGKVIVNALDVIENILLPGEKDLVYDAIESLCGYSEENLVEMAKNS